MTTTEVANRALTMLGESQRDQLVNIDTDLSDAAKLIRQFFEYTIRQVQSNFRWDELFVTAILINGEDLTADTRYNWGWRYPLPDDFVAPIWTDEYRYEIEGNFVYCNYSTDFHFQYRKYSEIPDDWSPQLLTAITHSLAMAVCIPITENEKKAELLLKEYESVILPRIERTSAYGKRKQNSRRISQRLTRIRRGF